jgi:hypothetical protein
MRTFAKWRVRPYSLPCRPEAGKGVKDKKRLHASKPICEVKRYSFWGFAPQQVELMPKCKDFGFQHSPRPDQGASDPSAEIAH